MGAIPGRSVYATGEVDNRILLKAIWSRRNHDDRVRQSRTVPFNVRSLFGACNSGTHTHIHTLTHTHTHTQYTGTIDKITYKDTHSNSHAILLKYSAFRHTYS